MNLEPQADRIVVKANDPEELTAAGLIIPKNAQERPQIGTVRAVGAGTKDEEMRLSVGDQVLYGKYSGVATDSDEGEVLVMKQSDVLCRIKH